MRSLDVILLKNAEAAGREAAEATTPAGEYQKIEKANDEAVYGDIRLDKAGRSALQDAYHRAFLQELNVREK
jgi:hypothetical protein